MLSMRGRGRSDATIGGREEGRPASNEFMGTNIVCRTRRTGMAIDIINDAWESWRFVDHRHSGISQMKVTVRRIDKQTGSCGEQIATLAISASVACA